MLNNQINTIKIFIVIIINKAVICVQFFTIITEIKKIIKKNVVIVYNEMLTVFSVILR